MTWQGMDFKRACAFLGGDILSDPSEMTRLAAERAERAAKDLDRAIQKANAARAELQAAQIHLHYHETMPELCRQKWIERGLTESDIGFWYLGGKADFVVKGWHTPTLTIPIVDEKRNLLNVKHRFLNPNPAHPNDKYRPEREGLGAAPPFLAVPEMGYDGGTTTWVLEGEIKAMVTWARCGDIDTQIIGVPGRSNYKSLAVKLKGKKVIIVPDPGAERDAWDFSKQIRGHFLMLPEKIDDLIVSQGYDGEWLKAIERQARYT